MVAAMSAVAVTATVLPATATSAAAAPAPAPAHPGSPVASATSSPTTPAPAATADRHLINSRAAARAQRRQAVVATSAAMRPGAHSITTRDLLQAQQVPTNVVTRTAVSRSLGADLVTPSTDATLSALNVTTAWSRGLGPAFAPAVLDYQLSAWDDDTATVTPTVNAAGAVATVSEAGTPYPLTGGAASVPLARGQNDITITVASADASVHEDYVVHVWRLAAPTSRFASIQGAQTSVFGGNRMTVTLTNGQLPTNCVRQFFVGGQYSSIDSSSFDATINLTSVEVEIPSAVNRKVGPADLTMYNKCWPGWWYTQSITTAPGAVTYVATPTVTSAVVPATLSSGSLITISGKDFGARSDLAYWLTDANGQYETDLWWWNWTGNNTVTFIIDYPWGESFFRTAAGPVTVHVGYCPVGHSTWNADASCTSLWSKRANWSAPVPSNLSFSPSSGPIGGGTVVTLTGRYIVSGLEDTTINVGGQPVSTFSVVHQAARGRDMNSYANDLDTVRFTVPPGVAPGAAPITVSTEVGTGTARGSFTYSARPSVTSIAPATVAHDGGAVITVTGANFGTAGTPGVIIDGVKSPLVTRISSTTLTAVVPASSDTGSVQVLVSSPQGGGVSDAADLTLAAATTSPTVTRISPASGRPGDTITLTGTGFTRLGTEAVSIDGNWTMPTSSTATGITVDVPVTDTAGIKDLAVGTTTGTVVKTAAFTMLPADGITTLTPSTVPSYATGAGQRIAVDGAGFGAKGTIKVGSAVTTRYVATANGSHIAGVLVPTSAAGPVPVTLTPSGASTALHGTVYVTAPVLNYVGSDPYDARFGPVTTSGYPGTGGYTLDVPTTGGRPVLLQGTGFGPGGVVKVGGATVATTSWSDTAIQFVAPAHVGTGTVAITVTPTGSSLAATRASGINYIVPVPAVPTISRIVAHSTYGRGVADQFDPLADVDDAFTLTGNNLTGARASATTVTVFDGSQSIVVTPTQVTATSLVFAAPRGFTSSGWKSITVTSDIGSSTVQYGIEYLTGGITLGVSPWNGICQTTSAPATGGVTYDPPTVTVTASTDAFGSSGTVSIGGVTVTPSSYTPTAVVVPMTSLATALANRWGWKPILITPTDTTLPAQTVNFDCAVTPAVTTTVNGATTALTVAAGTPYTLGYTTSGFVGTNPFSATAPSGYEYVSGADFASTGFTANVQAGVPAAAGDWYVRVSLARATYDPAPYLQFWPAPVHVTITGTPITVTPVSKNGSSFTYKGQLGDGTNGTPLDVGFTATSTTDPITQISWQYRDSICESQAASTGWIDGLPKNVARSSGACGGDGVTPSSWDVRVKSFQMTSNGTDRSIYYDATRPTTRFTLTPRTISVAAVRADKVYDGTVAAPLGGLTFAGAIDGDDVGLADAGASGTFANAAPGVNKAVTLTAPLSLSGSTAGDYTLANPQPTIVGTVSKAAAVLTMNSSVLSVLLSLNPTATVTTSVTDPRTGHAVDNTAAPVVLVSQTPSICTISGSTVTALSAGTCTIAGTVAASTDYTAATAASDPSATVETLDIKVFAAPRRLSVIADDLTVAVGDQLDPTYEATGLFDGDSIGGVTYDYYSGATLLTAAPTTAGTYKVVPKDGTLTAADPNAYANPSSFGYVAGKLVITPMPPTITAVAPLLGDIAGGTVVTITGTLLDTVKAVKIGGVTLKVGLFTVNQAGTQLRFTAPAVQQPGPVHLVLVAGSASASDIYTYTAAAPSAPRGLTVTGSASSLAVAFTVPASNGGARISGYQLSTDGGRSWRAVSATCVGTACHLTASGLANGASFSVAVRAVNSVGAGVRSSIVVARTGNPPRRPGVPRAVQVTVGSGRLIVGYTYPLSNGGAPITAYQVTVDHALSWHTVRSYRIAVSALTNGTHYDVQVRAVNRVGTGPWSTSTWVLVNAAWHPWLPSTVNEVVVPTHPMLYHGPRRYTRARYTTYAGRAAASIGSLGAHQMVAGDAVTTLRGELFAFDSARLTATGRAAVLTVARHLRAAHSVICEGYTDYAGVASHERSLSQARAHIICATLVAYGAHVITTARGYGGARPVIVGGTAQSRAENRRVVIRVSS